MRKETIVYQPLFLWYQTIRRRCFSPLIPQFLLVVPYPIRFLFLVDITVLILSFSLSLLFLSSHPLYIPPYFIMPDLVGHVKWHHTVQYAAAQVCAFVPGRRSQISTTRSARRSNVVIARFVLLPSIPEEFEYRRTAKRPNCKSRVRRNPFVIPVSVNDRPAAEERAWSCIYPCGPQEVTNTVKKSIINLLVWFEWIYRGAASRSWRQPVGSVVKTICISS
jgi:hypothetical protein